MNSINNQPSTFELLPMANILDQLNQVTGSKGIVNDADIPVIMRYVGNLACVSKILALKINEFDTLYVFFKSLSEKYGEPSESFAAKINTKSARIWMWNYIQRNGDDKVYQVIQDIYELAADIQKETKDTGLDFEFYEGHKGWQTPNPRYCQIKQGFILDIDWSRGDLRTPFGKISIYSGGSYSGNSPLSVSEEFIRRLTAQFEALHESSSERDNGKIYEIQATMTDAIRKIPDEELQIITKEDLISRKGTQNLIVNSYGGNNSSYKITEVKGKVVPEVIRHDSRKSMRSSETIDRIWEMLEANRSGFDPLAIKINESQVIYTEQIKPLVNTLSEVSDWAMNFVKILDQQPLFEGKTWISSKTKLLPLKAYSGAGFLVRLNKAAENFLDKDSVWHIHTFGGFDSRSFNGKDLGHGIELWISENPCDFQSLKVAYDTVIKSIGQNWVKSNLRDYPEILLTKSEEDYDLYVKKENLLPQEDSLLGCLAGLLDLSKSISCYSSWKGNKSSGIYFWIKNDKPEEIKAALNIV